METFHLWCPKLKLFVYQMSLWWFLGFCWLGFMFLESSKGCWGQSAARHSNQSVWWVSWMDSICPLKWIRSSIKFWWSGMWFDQVISMLRSWAKSHDCLLIVSCDMAVTKCVLRFLAWRLEGGRVGMTRLSRMRRELVVRILEVTCMCNCGYICCLFLPIGLCMYMHPLIVCGCGCVVFYACNCNHSLHVNYYIFPGF